MTCRNCNQNQNVHPTNNCSEYLTPAKNQVQEALDKVATYIYRNHYSKDSLLEFIDELRQEYDSDTKSDEWFMSGRHTVMYPDCNTREILFGGKLLSIIDEAAAQFAACKMKAMCQLN